MAYKFISVERKRDIAIITLRKPPENRLNVEACQELIRAYRQIEKDFGQEAEGAVILRGSDAKFFTTGLDLHERDQNIFASSDGFYPSVFPPTVPTASQRHADLFTHLL
jgi:enoyl-CoA hydratase/carnithine racemase